MNYAADEYRRAQPWPEWLVKMLASANPHVTHIPQVRPRRAGKGMMVAMGYNDEVRDMRLVPFQDIWDRAIEIERLMCQPTIPAPEPRNWYADYVARWRMSPVNFGYRFGTGVRGNGLR